MKTKINEEQKFNVTHELNCLMVGYSQVFQNYEHRSSEHNTILLKKMYSRIKGFIDALEIMGVYVKLTWEGEPLESVIQSWKFI